MTTHAILGCGFIAQKHKEAIEKLGGEVVGACDIVIERALRIAKKGVLYSDVECAIEDAPAEYIHICLPNYFHFDAVQIAVLENKKIFLEKPIAMSVNQAKRLQVENIAVCFQRRWNTQCKEIKALCEKERPKRIIANILVKRDPQYWECWRGDPEISGGGFVMNIAIHYLDLLQWWLGKEYKIDTASVFKLHRNIDEGVIAVMNFGGTEVIFTGHSLHHERDITMRVDWDDKSVLYDTDDASHYDVFKSFIEDNEYVTTTEAITSLQIVEDIYAFSRNANLHK